MPIYNSDASVGAPTEASGMNTNEKRGHPIPRKNEDFPSLEGKRESKKFPMPNFQLTSRSFLSAMKAYYNICIKFIWIFLLNSA
ncbi:MAG: hypothetical protein A3G52_01385 [Candidatus Taylorbacteria bacterium RIFCSPLOWO2_12_FULL_43_20]|uniref:Uncharacterized protein n=1 Tax=Candidatus Taylorbacteria bacterium RIFCSPLOWO2_12_FULL_43_20 TaxID=1802332 RepID=A0A1G2P3Y4_9BACT|nr:MAG: hypothetical protein A2825_01900 [Candidatus Taylorbacteria bacterium RIFCSPHIGHO2_01_FULL_43_120]OHA23802.1 MAG: hypothetical protein A3B98_04575 [Candidatus Taylorbacteria bacterium RIFCSPHIGHO2_02_FULL_43_55]OHA31332.1 MAG: hypothetical protein A3B09_02250 [Candidatus Taylorbacteria bacterium RIFCSPLOWO2_01_FULL_43_83]OHA42342.1 MAG: hypothetical protein A3G52_01385 [Candidatus Taylorbacteria bacterium RIFCSPLOWO2_12_FULL_43_20]